MGGGTSEVTTWRIAVSFQVEAIWNRKPIVPLSNEPNISSIFTQVHFLSRWFVADDLQIGYDHHCQSKFDITTENKTRFIKSLEQRLLMDLMLLERPREANCWAGSAAGR